MGQRTSKEPPHWTRHLGIGVEYAGVVAGFGLIGWWIDTRWDTAPWGVVVGAALGLIGATYNLVRQSLAAFRELDQDKDAGTRPNDERRDRHP